MSVTEVARSILQLHRLSQEHVRQLVEVLVAVVDDGASIGFLPPLDPSEAEAYWRGVLKPETALLVVGHDDRIDGTVQVHLESRANGRHRADIGKVMVHPRARRRGLARLFMECAEQVARENDRTLLILDTREGDPSNVLYRSMGYVEAGRIPRYARSATGELDASVFYFKELG